MNGLPSKGSPSTSNSIQSNDSIPCKKAADRKSPSPYRGEFVGKVVIVIGATKSLGRQIALSYGREGASLTMQGNSMDKLTSIKDVLIRAGMDERKVLMIIGNLLDEKMAQSMLERTVQKFGKIDTLVICNESPVIDTDSTDNFGENIRNLVQLSSMTAKYLSKTQGSIIALNALSPTKQTFSPWPSIYNGALDGWTRNSAKIFGTMGIRVNCIKIGSIRSDFRSRQTNSLENGDEFSTTKSNALCRLGTIDEVANVAIFLASSRASFLTSQILNADGGMGL